MLENLINESQIEKDVRRIMESDIGVEGKVMELCKLVAENREAAAGKMVIEAWSRASFGKRES